MIKLKDILNEVTSPVKIGSALPGSGGRKKEIDLVVDRFMGGKWTVVSFNMVRKYVSGVGVSPDRLINYDDIFELPSSEKNTIKKIIKNPEDIAYLDDENVKPIDVLRAIK